MCSWFPCARLRPPEDGCVVHSLNHDITEGIRNDNRQTYRAGADQRPRTAIRAQSLIEVQNVVRTGHRVTGLASRANVEEIECIRQWTVSSLYHMGSQKNAWKTVGTIFESSRYLQPAGWYLVVQPGEQSCFGLKHTQYSLVTFYKRSLDSAPT